MSKKTCEQVVYTSPSDSYDEFCGRPMVTVFYGHPICKRHLAMVIETEQKMIELRKSDIREATAELLQSKRKLKKLQKIMEAS